MGPAVIAIGFSVGTGSVTTLIVAGSRFGPDLLWVNFFSCLFSWACVEAYDRFYLATGTTALMGVKKFLPYGKLLAWTIIIGLSYGQYNSLMGNLSTTSNAIFEVLALWSPSLKAHGYWITIAIAVINISIMWFILNTNRYQLFEKVLTVFVLLMSFCFIASLVVVPPPVDQLMKGFIPNVPADRSSLRLIVAIVGTTMTAATFVTRPLFLQANGWGKKQRRLQRNDAILANTGIFIIGTAIMLIALSTMYEKDRTIEKVLDMVNVLEPVAGKFALFIFLTGTLSAGLTAVFPILMVTPMMLSDYQSGKFEMGTRQFKILTSVAALVGLIGPLLGKNPIEVQIFSQVFLVLILPLSVLLIIALVNRKSIMGDLKATWWLNLLLILSFLFAAWVSYYGVIDIGKTVKQWLH